MIDGIIHDTTTRAASPLCTEPYREPMPAGYWRHGDGSFMHHVERQLRLRLLDSTGESDMTDKFDTIVKIIEARRADRPRQPHPPRSTHLDHGHRTTPTSSTRSTSPPC